MLLDRAGKAAFNLQRAGVICLTDRQMIPTEGGYKFDVQPHFFPQKFKHYLEYSTAITIKIGHD